MAKQIPAATIETLARSIFKDASKYGFGRLDLIRLINELMDLCTGVDEHSGAEGDSDVVLFPKDQCSSGLPVSGERVDIRPYNGAADKALLQQWLPDKYGRYFVLSGATAQSHTLEAMTDSSNNALGIITLKDGKPIGAMAYLDIHAEQKRGELRKLIGDLDSRGKGLAEEATRLWLSYGVHSLGLEKIYVSTLQTQINNIRLNESVGFRLEGLLRNEVAIDGKRHDVLRMGFSLSEAESGAQ
ncbi:MAG: GNAT family protein [Pseudomonadota bacterium]